MNNKQWGDFRREHDEIEILTGESFTQFREYAKSHDATESDEVLDMVMELRDQYHMDVPKGFRDGIILDLIARGYVDSEKDLRYHD